MLHQAVQHSWIEGLYLLERRSFFSAGAINHAQVARSQHHDVFACVFCLAGLALLIRKTLALRAKDDVAVLGAASQHPAQWAADSLALIADGFCQKHIDVFPILVHIYIGLDLVLFSGQLLDELLERHVVALFKGRATTLAMVGEKDEIVGA